MRAFGRVLLLFLSFPFWSEVAIAAESAATWSITAEEAADAVVERPERCNADIRNGGGDLVEAGVRFRGKCEGAGIAPSIEKTGSARYLRFATDPSYRGGSKTRSELALTRKWFPFGEPVYIGFRLKVPEETDRTDAFFYLLQFWQCPSAAPIAGVRMNRGHSHRVNFMTRGDSRAASMAAYDLEPGGWSSFVIRAVVDPSGKNGSFKVWNDPDTKPRGYQGSYGYGRDGVCEGQSEPRQQFRIKFGIYKGAESNRLYRVDYDDIRIGSSFDAVSPWTDSGRLSSRRVR